MTALQKVKQQNINYAKSMVDKLKNKIEHIDFILDARPVGEIIKLRNELKKMLDENKTVEQRTSDEFVKKLEYLSEREKYWRNIHQKQRNTSKLIDKKIECELMLQEYKIQLLRLQD